MANRKVQQEVDKCFKQVAIGVEAFDEYYTKYEQSTNASQRDKLVDQIKKECKKLQRLRDQIKTWAQGNELKDKAPLLERRELIETKMEAFKAVEKEMKTKAFSKEGLNLAAKLDPREKEKEDGSDFLQEMIDTLEQQLEKLEADVDVKQMQVKKSKRDMGAKDQLAALEHRTSRHKYHISKLELLKRRLENDVNSSQQVKDLEEEIRDYVDNNDGIDFNENEEMYIELGLDDDDYGTQPMDKVSSHDNQSNSDDAPEQPAVPEPSKVKAKGPPDAIHAPHRRSSQQIKSPLPTLATLHNTHAPAAVVPGTMKPAPPPPKPAGEPLKYAFAAAAAVSTDKAGIGVAPLPPPAAATLASTTSGISGLPPATSKAAEIASPATTSAQTTTQSSTSEQRLTIQNNTNVATSTTATNSKSPAMSYSSLSASSPAVSTSQPLDSNAKENVSQLPKPNGILSADSTTSTDGTRGQNHEREAQSEMLGLQPNSIERGDDEPVYHLPASLQELVESYEAVKDAATPVSHPGHQRELNTSATMRPDTFDVEQPRHYKPTNLALYTPSHYPQEPLQIFDDPRLYHKIDTDALFYSFYYRQGTHQQYLAARALKHQSWRFHKQYQTWFQRHEEPKHITEDYEQGTYRFFDYESTWMNRRKADFKFAYKFLEDDL
ncbi:MAG: general negative regulator of transcription subunit 5 [Chrysothrix sp. TS-e1954]|nr:MAG: general negative regulator of transcription subunit 5 [Chrysothrix sp. TS-e1954]